jgi:hypothetical protein
VDMLSSQNKKSHNISYHPINTKHIYKDFLFLYEGIFYGEYGNYGENRNIVTEL